jgi:hypothetical protein
VARTRAPLPYIPDLPALVSAEKKIGAEPRWTLDGKDSDEYVLCVPLSVDGVIREGVFLDANCHKSIPDHDVTFNLTYKPVFGYSGALIRLDWNPFHTHGNSGLINGEWKWKEIRTTHIHPFKENHAKGMK